MDQRMNEAVKVAVQIQSDRLHEEAQIENDEFHKTVDENMKKIIKEQVDTLTLELLAGPTYELMKGSCKSLTELEYHLEEVFKAITDQLDWVNPKGSLPLGRKHQQFYGFSVNRESARDVYSKRRIIAVTELKIIEWHSYKNLD
nr:hypothetical protein [Tanacetum cinerariifolium]